ncbi:Uncharacterized protein, possibly involved in utilization of glycolate and propanediol OS=Singulisphaera acidiphila (strain ATCC BAA-1392 / DSM 18658 / VKM B-2454 / MOB10) GN=Sinac_0910 PE=4 SV=1: DUF336 [Gemmataceae bacterium]|nr:Uncharacterized protein, possibly involved in utilization of glycolate and propanediol OS=Singulisphaera acidiphila (strain ATCC BAA-1392 / DSM 18658 / VKM B-2454 / MOB10) GN=Sinac_0910 PE=4 SV=1: DUF336 [Gemmataceae bacterium]VTT96701.1 Uncharacterized protein, possibly involved in utilization of glycolate and propanediol OS=Singulisphaera acidiphila (strain ATCC BAA-1392 / DSM 18658 / VKM B-2454 / MOB10) GN=Sinac_0910 PE=4 SV=1: DUF336 [Gemmataceae bacterium]
MSNEKGRTRLKCEHLDARHAPAVATLAGGVLTVTGDATADRIRITPEGDAIQVLDGTVVLGQFAAADVATIVVNGGDGNDTLQVSNLLVVPVTFNGGNGNDKLVGGGGGAVLNGDAGSDQLTGGLSGTVFDPGAGADRLYRVEQTDVVNNLGPDDQVLMENPLPVPKSPDSEFMTASEVDTIIRRAAAASASNDAIIVITDRNGRILGVRVEDGVAPEITSDPSRLVFAIDGAVSLARTGAFFGNNAAPLTSRTVRSLSQSTITQREVESLPYVTDPNSTVRGPGFVAPVGINGHFPPGVVNTPQVDLFNIEHTNRDGTYSPGPDRIIGTADDELRTNRFNIDSAFVPPGAGLFPPDSYGVESGVAPRTANGIPIAQNRGIATLPGGIPIFKNGQVVGGIGVFFPGKTGYATESNSSLSVTFDPTKPDRTLEAEWIAYAAVGGTINSVSPGVNPVPIGPIAGVAVPTGYGLPTGRIDLVGIQLDIFGPGGVAGINTVLNVGSIVGRGDPLGANQVIVAGDPNLTRDGLTVPEGWLVVPHDGVGIKAADVMQIITQGINQANVTRAAIRLPLGTRTKMVFAVSDLEGNIVGLYRDPDATVFSIDVAVAKARNVAYYANPAQLQAVDQLDGVPAGTAFEARTFRYLALPRFPESVQGAPPGPFSQLNDGGVDPLLGITVGNPLPASAYQSVLGYDSFNPGTNFRAPTDIKNQNGIVFFPGAAPVYTNVSAGGQRVLIGGLGVSGDGVDQDDVMTIGGQAGYNVPANILRADQVLYRGVRLPYQKTNRNPEG